jgi:protein-S-isoprenylcysteine O-methyltransferase Ste14
MPVMIKIVIFLSYLFLFSELILMVTKRSKRKTVKKKGDKGSLIMLWIIIAICLTVGFNLANFGKWDIGDYLICSFGLLMLLAGMIIRWASIKQLKNAFTVDVAINRLHELKTDGLYRIIRHPSYLGLLLIMTGLSLGMASLLSCLVVIIPFSLVLLFRMRIEENTLLGEFGEEYKSYMRSTKKIIPFIY